MTTVPDHANRMLFVTLPVRDVAASKAFFAQLGFGSDPRFAGDGTGACISISEQGAGDAARARAVGRALQAADGRSDTHALALYCFSVANRDEVDTIADAAIAAGAENDDDAEDHGFMYTRSFSDLDRARLAGDVDGSSRRRGRPGGVRRAVRSRGRRGEGRRMITGTDFVYLPTRDFDRAVEIDDTTLGLPCSARYGKRPGAEFETGSLTLAVIAVEDFGMEFHRSHNVIALRVEDVEASRAGLESKGVEFTADTIDSGGCHMAFFADPDGNALMLHHRYAPRQRG